ncbi:MAG: glutathione S-transferase family protein [Desulfuromonadales bacterium]|nr:glutathione S-transferase family protein [Desulfuromonadales bacterium]
MLVKGQWQGKWDPITSAGRHGQFLRQVSSIRNWITRDGSAGPTGASGFRAESGRYHLYLALICPWACRTLIARMVKGLEPHISISIVSPDMTDQGWRFGHFPGATLDHLHNSEYLHQLYTRNDPFYSGRATVPVLWDKERDLMVNNESADILRMLNSAFEELAPSEIDLYPLPLRDAIDTLNEAYYRPLNNGVYRAGFATSQQAYEQAYTDVFNALDDAELRLADQRFLFGDLLTETDIRLFVTLVRFDVAYYGLFKCNRKRIADYPHLSRYLRCIYNLPGIRDTVDFDHIKQGYYSIGRLNPNGIIPLGPELDLQEEPIHCDRQALRINVS